jgi:outer membrane protein assembly factor BamB
LVIITLILLGTFYGLSRQSRVYAASSAIDWPMYHHDVAHTGYSNGTASTTLPAQLWNYTLELDQSSMPHSPAVTDGFVYVNSGYNISCFAASTGANIWNFPVVSYAYSAPAVVNGRVYVGSVNGGVYSLDASSGLQVWNYSTGDSFDSSPTVVNDLSTLNQRTATSAVLMLRAVIGSGTFQSAPPRQALLLQLAAVTSM